MPSFARKLLALSASSVLALGALELTLRATTPLHAEGWFEFVENEGLFYQPTPSLSYRLDDAPYTHNALAMRDPVERTHSSSGGARVAFVGDSVCYGVGVGDSETTSSEVERLLRAGGSDTAETLNLGVPGYNSHQVATAVEERVSAFDDVHWVVYLYHENDVVNATFSNADVHLPAQLFHRYEKPGPAWRRWLKRSHLAMFLYKLGRGGGTALAGSDRFTESTPPSDYRAPYDTYRGLLLERGRYHDNVRANLRRLAGACGSETRALLVYVPSFFSLHLDREDQMAGALRALATECGLDFLNGRRALLPADRALYYDAGHPNGEGHARLAAAIAATIQS